MATTKYERDLLHPFDKIPAALRLKMKPLGEPLNPLYYKGRVFSQDPCWPTDFFEKLKKWIKNLARDIVWSEHSIPSPLSPRTHRLLRQAILTWEMDIVVGRNLVIREVWTANLQDEFKTIRSLIRTGYNYVAIVNNFLI